MMEFVAVLPVMFLVILGSVDVCNNIFVQQFLTDVSYQGTLEGAEAGVSEEVLHDSISAYLTARDIGEATIITRGTDGTAFEDVDRGEAFEVIVSLAAVDRSSSPVIFQYFDLTALCVGLRQ